MNKWINVRTCYASIRIMTHGIKEHWVCLSPWAHLHTHTCTYILGEVDENGIKDLFWSKQLLESSVFPYACLCGHLDHHIQRTRRKSSATAPRERRALNLFLRLLHDLSDKWIRRSTLGYHFNYQIPACHHFAALPPVSAWGPGTELRVYSHDQKRDKTLPVTWSLATGLECKPGSAPEGTDACWMASHSCHGQRLTRGASDTCPAPEMAPRQETCGVVAGCRRFFGAGVVVGLGKIPIWGRTVLTSERGRGLWQGQAAHPALLPDLAFSELTQHRLHIGVSGL